MTFFAVRDFVVEALPSRAWLQVVADEAYVVYLNGQRLGSNFYRQNQAMDLYPLSDFLRSGRNRLAIELRSERGAGGLLANLRLGDLRQVVLVTDVDWQIFRQFEPAFFVAEDPLPGGEAPQVWGHAPTGRFRVKAPEHLRPVPPYGASALPALRLRNLNPQARWVDLTRPRRKFPQLGPILLFDWQSEVSGYLSIDFAPSSGQPGWLFFGTAAGMWGDVAWENIYWQHLTGAALAAQTSTAVFPAPRSITWSEGRWRRFRYLLTVGIEVNGIPVLEAVNPDLAAKLELPSPTVHGVFGLPPHPQPRLDVAVWERVLRENPDLPRTLGARSTP